MRWSKSRIDDTSVLAIRDSIKARYLRESSEETNVLKKELLSAQEQNIQIQQQAASAVREKQTAQQATNDAKKALLADVESRSQKKASRRTSIIVHLVRLVLIGITAFCIYLSFYSGLSSQEGLIALILAIISGCSTATLFLPVFKVLNWFKTYVYRKVFDKVYAKEYSKIETQIEILSLGNQAALDPK